MGLFDMFDGKKEQPAGKKSSLGNFSVRKTANVPKLLKQIAKETGVATQDIDFDIINTHTETLFTGKEGEMNAGESGPSVLDKDALLNPGLSIRQIYEISIRPPKPKKNFNLLMKMAVNKTYSRVRGIISKESVFVYSEMLEDMLIKELNKKKVRSGMLIDLFDDKMKEGVKNLVTKIRVNDRLTEDYTLELCHWVDPVPSVDDAIVLHNKETKQKEVDENEKVDYAERGFISTIEKDEIAVEYIKPQEGLAGRNFRGEYIAPKEPAITHEPKFVVDADTIEVKETPQRTLYIAKTKGYVKMDDTELLISDTLEIDSANFKSTGNINAGNDKDIKIALKTKDKHEDNIGPNTKIEASEIHVEGSVANGAEVKGDTVRVDGQTHKSSKIFAKDAYVGIHRGQIHAKKIEIDKLENGEVVGDDIKIHNAIGGTVRGKRIEVGNLFSNVRIIASKTIEITGELKGSDNHLIIEPGATDDEKEKIANFTGDIKVMEKKVQDVEKKLNEKKRMLQQVQDSSANIKQIILEAKKAGRKPPQAVIDKYKRNMEVVNEVKDIQDEFDFLQQKLEKEKDEIMLIQDAALHATITNRHVWRTHNKVYYKLLDPQTTVEYIPKVGMGASTLALRQVGEGEYKVEVTLL